jgi:hypothetical protein
MKHSVLLSVLVTFQSLVFGQIHTDPGLDKFAGHWRWVNIADTVEIILQRQTVTNPMSFNTVEVIAGWHRYVENGMVQQSSFQFVGTVVFSNFNNPSSFEKVTMVGGSYSVNTLLASPFIDIHLHKTFELFLTLLPNSLTQLNWDLRQPRGLYAGPVGLNGIFSLPRTLVLTKL